MYPTQTLSNHRPAASRRGGLRVEKERERRAARLHRLRSLRSRATALSTTLAESCSAYRRAARPFLADRVEQVWLRLQRTRALLSATMASNGGVPTVPDNPSSASSMEVSTLNARLLKDSRATRQFAEILHHTLAEPAGWEPNRRRRLVEAARELSGLGEDLLASLLGRANQAPTA